MKLYPLVRNPKDRSNSVLARIDSAIEAFTLGNRSKKRHGQDSSARIAKVSPVLPESRESSFPTASVFVEISPLELETV